MANNPTPSQVRVGVRIRPLTSKETTEGGQSVVDGNAFHRTVSLGKRKFTYDNVFHSNVTQSDLYANVAPPLLNSFLNGYNATVLAYGQTGSGKTYTMGSEAHGDINNFVSNDDVNGVNGVNGVSSGGGGANGGGSNLGENDGLIPRFMEDLFGSLIQRREASEKALLQSRDEDNKIPNQSVSLVDFRVSASFLEVYGEDIYDLLDEDRNALKIREDSKKEVIIVGLQNKDIHNASEAMNVLNTGTMNRTTASTLMNFTSSRSHAVFTVNLQQTTRGSDGDEVTSMSRFTFVDLAGSERMKKTGAEGERAKEGIKINEGLLALGNVINALADDDRLAKGEKVHVPYRQSKLTRLLQDALGGNSQTLFLACVSPSDTNASETISTLHYANRARNIKNSPTRNVDATAEELRRFRTLTNLLKCELIKLRFDSSNSGGGGSSLDPEVERASNNESAIVNPAEIGRMNDDLLRREDVIAYMKLIDEKVSELSGSSSTSAVTTPFVPIQSRALTPERPPMPHSYIDTTSSHSSRESTSFANLSPVPVDDDDDYSEMGTINPEDDMQLIDELLENQNDEQISKIEGDIEEQEERLLQLKEHIKVYHDMKEKYELLMDHVEKLESEKAQLAEKLKEIEKDPSKSHSIEKKLENVKASLTRARQDVRKQQQKCREAEQDAQRCKGLERRIEEMKNAKAHLIKKQKDDAMRQKDFTKTKAREIQHLRRNEKSAQKKVVKLEAECQRYKTSLQSSKARYEKLTNKLKQTESHLKQANAKKRTNSSILGSRHGSDHSNGDGLGQFAPASGKINSIKFVLDKTVSDRVALSQNREVYALKAAEREELVQSMATEVKTLNELKRECESMAPEQIGKVLSKIHYAEEYVQEFLIKIELVETHLEELRCRYPSIEDDSKEKEVKDNVFDEHEPALKMVSKLNGPILRTLLLKLLGSCYTAERGRQTMKDALVKKDFVLSTLENEVATLNEKVNCLSKSLAHKSQERLSSKNIEKLDNERGVAKAELDSFVSDTDALLLELGKANGALLESEEKHKETIAEITERLSASHAEEVKNLRARLESSSTMEIQRVISEVEQQRVSEVERITNELNESHARELATVKSDALAISEQLEKLTASHHEELERVRSEADASTSGAIAQTNEQLATSHAKEIQNLKAELQAESSTELEHIEADAALRLESEVERITNDLNKSHAVEIQLSIAKQSEELTASHGEELARLRSEMELSTSEAIAQATEKLATSHTTEIKKLQSELRAATSSEIECILADAEQQRVSEAERITNELKESYAEIQSEIVNSQSAQIEQLTASHNEELARVRSEMEVSRSEAIAHITEQLATSHAKDIQILKAELQASASSELERVQADAEAQRVSEAERITNELKESHAAELQSQSEQFEELTASHSEELARVRSEMEASTSEAIAQTTEQLTTSHAKDIQILRAELQASASSELERVQADAELQRMSEVERTSNELKEFYATELQSAVAKSQSEQLEHLATSHSEELARVRSEMEVSRSEAIAQTTEQLATSHAKEIQNLKTEFQAFASLELERAQADAEQQRVSEAERITNELEASHAAELQSAIAKSRSAQLDELTASHNEELAQVRSEMEVSRSEAIAQITEQLTTSHAKEIQMLRSELQSDAEQQRVSEAERIKNELKESHAAELEVAVAKSQSEQLEHLVASHKEEMAHVQSKMEASTSEILAQQKQIESIEEKLNTCIADKNSMLRELKQSKEVISLYKKKQMKAEEQVAQMLSQQKKAESIEDQVNLSISNKDLLLREFEKTALLKELEKAKKALSKLEEKQAALQTELKTTKEALSLSNVNNAKAERQLTQKIEEMQAKSIRKIKRENAIADNNRRVAIDQPQDPKEKGHVTPTKSTSLAIDTSTTGSHASSEKTETPSSSRSSSSAVIPSYSKLQRYRKKFREHPKTADGTKPAMDNMSQESAQDIKQEVADSRRQARYRDSSYREIGKSPR